LKESNQCINSRPRKFIGYVLVLQRYKLLPVMFMTTRQIGICATSRKTGQSDNLRELPMTCAICDCLETQTDISSPVKQFHLSELTL